MGKEARGSDAQSPGRLPGGLCGFPWPALVACAVSAFAPGLPAPARYLAGAPLGIAYAQPPTGRDAHRATAARAERLVDIGRAFALGGDRGRATGYFRDALAVDPSCLRAYLELGKGYLAREAFDDAEATFRAGLRRYPAGHRAAEPLALALVRTLRARGEPAQASERLARYLNRRPESVRGWQLAFSLSRERGAWTEALNALRVLRRLAADRIPPSGPVATPEPTSELDADERALQLLADPLDPVSSARACGLSAVRRLLAGCERRPRG